MVISQEQEYAEIQTELCEEKLEAIKDQLVEADKQKTLGARWFRNSRYWIRIWKILGEIDLPNHRANLNEET